ncbi:SDR family oxidoreductase [Variovorax sp. YR216]|uniref:SDR family oxidoreductase n=1 Tax=Variovorax sp. YR216 TaxID=1882828 RepID=UPI00089BD6E5|nr:SDR family oxidoreductase [Variovorax sp. YR216]SEB15681.1 NAD(P)-dependent dehydrogenase, short-chain alcohol dehydrogenase family [Variovorax sp. YR216]
MTAVDSQRVLVTAGAGGIGRSIAMAFASAGARVHACDIDANALDELRTQAPGITTSVCDIADRGAVQRMVQEATDALGGLDVLVNNAGIAGPTASVADMDPDAWEAVLRINLTGTFTVTQAAIPHLKKSAAGSIVVMSSLAGRFGYPNRSPYATTKWGLIGFTKTLARELGEFGIRVNAILPGAVDGPRLRQVFEGRASVSGRSMAQEEAAALANQSIKRFVDPADIAALVVFLASGAGRSISGQMIPIDGDSQAAS